MKKSVIVLLAAIVCYVSTTIHAGEIGIGCERFRLFLSPRATVEEVVSPHGVINTEEESSVPREPDSLLTLELQETVYGIKDGKRRRIALDSVTQTKDKFVFSNNTERTVRVTFQAANKKDYLTLRLVKVETAEGEHAARMEFNLIPGLRIFPLNPEVIRNREKSIVFSGLLKRSPDTKLGAVAIWHPESEELDDEILYQVWVKENLPHPKTDGDWTVQRAKQWVAEYIRKFSRYSELYITGENLQELKDCVDYAAKMKMASVYLHINTWGGRYQPDDRDTYTLNEKIFPNGHADFKELCDYAHSKGVGVAIRTLSNSISLKNPVYVSNKPDKRLGHFWRGTLVKEIGPESDEVVIKSDRTLPTSYGMPLFDSRPNPRAEHRFVHIDDEVLEYSSFVENKDGSITLKVATRKKKLSRGYGWTEASAHRPGASVRILTGTFIDKVAPDHDSSLLDEIAGRYADFNNKMQLINSSFDGLMLYTICTGYGETKFPGAIYSRLDHPTWPTTSNGRPKWGFFEIDFNSVKNALGLEKPREIPQRMFLMLGLHQDHWAAPSPYGYSYCIVPNAVAGYGSCSIQEQTGFHDVRLDTFKKFGLVDLYTTAIEQWREYGPSLPNPVKERIFNAYDGSLRYPLQIEHFRFEETGNNLEVVPFRPMRREVGDKGWGYLQEHGPIYTYQYMRPNTKGLLQLDNPYREQVPEFIIRVMRDFRRDILTGFVDKQGAGGDNAQLNDWLDQMLGDSKVTIHDKVVREATGKVNYRIMIPLDAAGTRGQPTHKVDPGQMDLEIRPDGARITYENKAGKTKTFDLDDKKKNSLVTYNSTSSVYNAKGLGIVITGDGSNAMFVVRIRGGGTRDYVIPVDFKGKRYIEIPDPQVSWSEARWPITSAWKRWQGHTVKTVIVGFGSVPPGTKASVFVEDIRLLPEKTSALKNPVVRCGSGTISIRGVIPSDHHIWYTGGNRAEVFDLNWNKLQELPVVVSNAEVPSGRSDISIKNNNEAGDPWLECQFFVRDKSIHRITRK